ncbi:MAG: NADH-quinone oxidoreductase subunit NuoH [Anaerolineae bacterium]|nr:MAG: NADH-quinone oxidoreductase subunit NuoH [Anaerolineae bacterium]
MDWIDTWLIPIIMSWVIGFGLLIGFAYTTWLERRGYGLFQLRRGPNRAGPFGLLQPWADALKAFFKEELVLDTVDKVIYLIAPGIAMGMSLLPLGVIPFGKPIHLFGREIPLHLADVSIGLLWILSVAGLGTYGIVLGGWSSNNKYSLLGALRTTAQLLSYELPLGLAILSVVLTVGSLKPSDIVAFQSPVPLIVLQPVAFLIFIISIFAETNRSPFDLPETENELTAGFSTEYNGIKFALFFMTEYIGMINASALCTTLFLGGWRGPFVDQVPILSLFYFAAKVIAMLLFFVWVRASLPRVRFDKSMAFNWKFLMPLGLANLAVTAVVLTVLP